MSSVNRSQVTIPTPVATLDSLHATAVATKELAETLAGQRGLDQSDAAITWNDLVQLGLIQPDQVPGFRGLPRG